MRWGFENYLSTVEASVPSSSHSPNLPGDSIDLKCSNVIWVTNSSFSLVFFPWTLFAVIRPLLTCYQFTEYYPKYTALSAEEFIWKSGEGFVGYNAKVEAHKVEGSWWCNQWPSWCKVDSHHPLLLSDAAGKEVTLESVPGDFPSDNGQSGRPTCPVEK